MLLNNIIGPLPWKGESGDKIQNGAEDPIRKTIMIQAAPANTEDLLHVGHNSQYGCHLNPFNFPNSFVRR